MLRLGNIDLGFWVSHFTTERLWKIITHQSRLQRGLDRTLSY
jgi:hypothetical protein